MKRKVVAKVLGEVSNNNMNKKNKHLGSKVNPPTDTEKKKTLTQQQLLNLGYILGEKCECKQDNKVYHLSEVLDEDKKKTGFCVARHPEQTDWSVLPNPYSAYAPKKKYLNSK